MDTRSLKTGHWYATENNFESFSTGDLFPVLEQAAAGELGTPVAVHVSPNPIKAMHAYLWAPVVDASESLTVSFGEQKVLLEWPEFEQLVEDIEELRAAGFRVKDVRSGDPRVKDLEELGVQRYREIENQIKHYRGGSLFELALTASTS